MRLTSSPSRGSRLVSAAPSSRFRPRLHPRTIVFRYIKPFEPRPCLHRALSCGAPLRSQEVAHEVDVSPMGNSREWSDFLKPLVRETPWSPCRSCRPQSADRGSALVQHLWHLSSRGSSRLRSWPCQSREELDGVLELVFAEFARRRDPDHHCKRLELRRVPIAIVKLRHGHRWRELRFRFQEEAPIAHTQRS